MDSIDIKGASGAAKWTIPSATSTLKDSNVFKPKDARKLLKKLKPDKATGPDQIPTRVFKECSSELASPLCQLFNLCCRRKSSVTNMLSQLV